MDRIWRYRCVRAGVRACGEARTLWGSMNLFRNHLVRLFLGRSIGPSQGLNLHTTQHSRRARAEPDGTLWRTGREVKGKLANGVGSQYSNPTSERGLSSITQADAHTSAASSRLNWRLHRFKWTRPFRGETKSGFCACAITFRTSYTSNLSVPHTERYKPLAARPLLWYNNKRRWITTYKEIHKYSAVSTLSMS